MKKENIDDYMENNQFYRSLVSVFSEDSRDDNQLYNSILRVCNEELRQQEANLISKHLEKLAIQGFHIGAIAPFGYSVVSVDYDSFGHIILRKKLILHPNESKTVKTLFELASKLITQGKFSYTAIARMLNEKGLHRRKTKWSPKNVKSTLINPRYHGVTIYGVKRTKLNSHKKPIEIDCLAIVSKLIFDKVNRFITELRI
jgi:hypothetical protein